MIALGLLAAAQPLTAHPAPFSYFNVDLRADAIEASLVVHVWDVAHELGIQPMERLLDPGVAAERARAIQSLLASRLKFSADGELLAAAWEGPEILRERQSLRFRLRYPASSRPRAVVVETLMFPYDPNHQTFINVYENSEIRTQAILSRSDTTFEYDGASSVGALQSIRRFVPAGVHHILIGPDHILFLIGLMLLGGTLRQLLLVVTAFTAAHSVTLSLAALGVWNPPARVIEPAIALSIVYVGADNILAKGGRDVRAWIALAFGFIHGFGFANVLREMDLPRQALGWSLFSFNLGVEIGQLFIVAAAASALHTLRSYSERAWRGVALAGSVAVIAAGIFWFVERVFFTGGSHL